MTHLRKVSRRGFALLTVIIVAAILVVSAFMLTTQLATESHISKTDSMFKSALSEAEAGLNIVLANIRNKATAPDGTSWATHFGTFETGVRSLPVIADISEVSGVRGAYSVSLDLASSSKDREETVGTSTVEYWSGDLALTAAAAIYPPSVATMLNGTSLADGYTARRALKTLAHVNWTRSVNTAPKTTITFPINYGVFSGGDVTIKSASSEWDGDVYATGDAYIQKQDNVVGGTVFAYGQVTGGHVPSVSNAPYIPFPEMDVAYLQERAAAYLNGDWPYDGTELGYTNTAAILAAADPMDSKYVAIQKLMSNPADMSAYIDPTAVYFVSGSMALHTGSLQGTLVVSGDIRFDGPITAASGGVLPTIVAVGDIIKGNGCSEISGIVYTGGSFTGNGTATITGALIARETVAMNGTLDIHYDAGPGEIVIGGSGGDVSAPLYSLGAMALPDDVNGRIWQEVVPD